MWLWHTSFSRSRPPWDEERISCHCRRVADCVRIRDLCVQWGCVRFDRLQVHDHSVVQVRPGQLFVLQRMFQLPQQSVQWMLLVRGWVLCIVLSWACQSCWSGSVCGPPVDRLQWFFIPSVYNNTTDASMLITRQSIVISTRVIFSCVRYHLKTL